MTSTASKTANRALWTAQVLLALLFLFAGVMKLVIPLDKMQGPVALPDLFIRFIGVAETAGALGLILPGLFHIRTKLTWVAAVGLVTIMSGATTITIESVGFAPAIFPLVVGIVAAVIAYGRSSVVPLREGYRAGILRAA